MEHKIEDLRGVTEIFFNLCTWLACLFIQTLLKPINIWLIVGVFIALVVSSIFFVIKYKKAPMLNKSMLYFAITNTLFWGFVMYISSLDY
jgi:type III secretory pathway component EscT